MIIAIIQARMGSTRLPGKVLKEVNGVPLLKRMLDRVARSKKIDKIIVATSELVNDDPISQFCVYHGVDVFRGSENDVLSRYYDCATHYKASTVVRLTADCPLIDPAVIDQVISLFEETKSDYTANTAPPENNTFPDGGDVEVFSYEALKRAHHEASKQSDREHVTFYFWQDPSRGFKISKLNNTEDWSKYRLTVDYPEDLEVVTKIFAEFDSKGNTPGLSDIICYLEKQPEIYGLNSKYYFGQGWSKK